MTGNDVTFFPPSVNLSFTHLRTSFMFALKMVVAGGSGMGEVGR